MELVVGVIILFVVFVIIVALSCEQGNCDICGLSIKRKYYTWEIGGKKQKLCPKCNAQMERRVSNNAFKERFG